MNIQELLGSNWEWITGLSLGSVAISAYALARFFKKGKFVLQVFGVGYNKMVKLFGKSNTDAFINLAKDVKIEDIPERIKEFADEQLKIEKMLALVIKINLANGVLDDNIELKEEAEKLV